MAVRIFDAAQDGSFDAEPFAEVLGESAAGIGDKSKVVHKSLLQLPLRKRLEYSSTDIYRMRLFFIEQGAQGCPVSDCIFTNASNNSGARGGYVHETLLDVNSVVVGLSRLLFRVGSRSRFSVWNKLGIFRSN